MAFTVRQLIGTNKKVVTVLNTDAVKKAQSIMVEHQFSQLPVIDNDGKALGLISSDSILRALNTFGVSLDELRVLDAMEKTKHTFKDEDDLFDLLNDLIETYAVLIVDREHRLQGIVTSYDTTQYFRQRSQDMMYAEDIETMLKDYINAYFTDETGQIDESTRSAAIADIMPSNQELLKPFKQALTHYIQFEKDSQTKLRSDLAEQAFSQYVYQKKPAEAFDRLTQDQYITLFLHKDRWSRYSSIFTIDRQKIRGLLENAKKPRNAAAHFRIEEITPEQREHLEFCRDWLAYHQNAIFEEFAIHASRTKEQQVIHNIVNIEERLTSAYAEASVTTEVITAELTEIPEQVTKTSTITGTETTKMSDEDVRAKSISTEISPIEEKLTANDSRYAPLAIWLQNQHSNEISLSFRQIEEIIGDQLPSSARQHRSWWANDSVSHIQSQQWLEAGWRVSVVDIAQERVIFTHIKDRGKSYDDFFSTFHEEISQLAHFKIKPYSPRNRNWMTIGHILGYAYFNIVFTYRRSFRVELYIDTGNTQKNKEIFDMLMVRKNAIELEVSAELSWERLEGKRTSRIAYYHDGSITDDSYDLAKLREWAVDAMLRFQPVMERHVSEVIHDL